MVRYEQSTIASLLPHYEELARLDFAEMVSWPGIVLAPNVEFFMMAEARDIMRAYTGWDGDQLVAYAFFTITHHHHYKRTDGSPVVRAVVDDYYVRPDYRIGRVAQRFVEFVEQKLRTEFEHLFMIQWGSREGFPAARRLLESMGYEALDTTLCKVVAEGVGHA